MCLVIGQSPLRRKIDLTHSAQVPIPGCLLKMNLLLRMERRERERGGGGDKEEKRKKD
jgi:hypothetical protein